jgi:hypothetical protein
VIRTILWAEAGHVTQIISAITPIQSEHNAWDQLAEESSKAFHAFTVFRDQGWARTVKRVVEEEKKAQAMIYRWSVAYRWRERAQAWDAFQDQLGQAQAVRTRMEMNKATLTIAQTMLTKAAQGYLALETVRKVKDAVTKEEKMQLAIKPGELLHILQCSHKLSQDLLGKSDEDQVANIQVIFGSVPPDQEPPLDV